MAYGENLKTGNKEAKAQKLASLISADPRGLDAIVADAGSSDAQRAASRAASDPADDDSIIDAAANNSAAANAAADAADEAGAGEGADEPPVEEDEDSDEMSEVDDWSAAGSDSDEMESLSRHVHATRAKRRHILPLTPTPSVAASGGPSQDAPAADDAQSGDEDGEYEYEAVEDVRQAPGSRKADNLREYLVKWKGYPSSENTWEPECEDMLPYIVKYWADLKADAGWERKGGRYD